MIARVRTALAACLMSLALLLVMTPPQLAEASTTADVWDGSVATEFAGGSGTEDDPYQIETAAQLAYFSEAFTSSTCPDFEDAYVVLTSDIDLNNIEWTPIGSLYTSYFWGSFDGQGYTISNMKITKDVYTQQYDTVALFGVSEASISNLNVQGEITVTVEGGASYYGGIVGLQCGNMDNCTSDVDITLSGSYYNSCFIGGVVGDFQGGYTLSNCINYGGINFLSTTAYGDTCIGGIAGDVYISTIDSCKNEGNITSYASNPDMGGITGFAYTSSSGNVVISNCYNTGTLTCYAEAFAAGIVGYMSAGSSEVYGITVTNCFSIGELEGTSSNMGAVYSSTKTSGGTITFSDLYYLSTSVSDSPVANDDATSVVATDTADFLAQISADSGTDAWTTDADGNVVLVMEVANYAAVEDAIQSIPEDLSVYTDESVAVLTSAQDAVVYNLLKSEQASVDAYAAAIEDAIAGLVYKTADYSAVNDAIAQAEALDSSLYSNYADVQAAIDAVVWDLDITNQDDVDAYASAIEDALAALEEIPVSEDSDSEDLESNSEDSDSADSNNNSSSKDNVLPETGDSTSITLWSLLSVFALGFALMFFARKKLNN